MAALEQSLTEQADSKRFKMLSILQVNEAVCLHLLGRPEWT